MNRTNYFLVSGFTCRTSYTMTDGFYVKFSKSLVLSDS